VIHSFALFAQKVNKYLLDTSFVHDILMLLHISVRIKPPSDCKSL